MERVDSHPHKNWPRDYKTFLSTISYSKLYSYSVYRGYKTFSYSNSYKKGNFSSNLWSVLKMAAHGRFNFQRCFQIASFDANGSFGICRIHSKTLRRRKYSKNIVFVTKLSCTSSPFYLTCPDPDGGIAPCLLFCKLSCAMHLLIIDSLSLSRSSGGRWLRKDAMHITSLCGQFIKFPTGAAANEAKQALSSIAVRYHLNTIHMKMHEK